MKKTKSEHGRESATVSKPAGYVMIFLAYGFGAISLIFFMIFLFKGSLNFVSLNLSHTAALGLNMCLSLAFFIQHSIMIRCSFRSWVSKFIKTPFHGALYTIASGTFLLIVFVFWQESDVMLASPQGPGAMPA